ncbi:hypothetical protein [Vibrio rotiferianus]|uniref:hypothetical protein n=1 Tax=Vibrio rotiferianus TaxID=190895 RepID=UPI0002376B76|nr:hypothetical protein [Vibrio rotiferianus]
MKYFFLALTVIFSQFANAGSGKALIPHWHTSTSAWFFISNITNNPIEVRMKLYDQDGNIVNLEEVGLSSQFILDPKTSKWLKTQKYINKFGFGSISWKNLGSDDDEVAITAAYEHLGGHRGKFLMLNSGQPF